MGNSRREGVYGHAELHRALAPRSVAVVGASTSPGPFGSRVIQKLAQAGFRGPVYPVNPKYDRIGDHTCYPSVAALPETPDCVVISVPRDGVEPVVRDCADRGVGGVIIFSSGYAETGDALRVQQQERLVEICRAGGVRLIGPNCLGLLNYNNGFQATFGISPFADPPTRPAIGLISQSGGLAFPLAQASERGVCFSHVLTMGNACDVDAADLISYLADEPSCHAIACVFEGMPHPRRLIQAAQRALAADKPLVICKLATGELGSAAALSHTGNLAGSNAAYMAAFRRCGAVVVDKFEALVETTSFLMKAGRARASGVGVLATSGGACVMLADMAERHDVPLPQPAPEVREVLASVIPEFGSPNNPCDVTGQVQASQDAFFRCVDAMMGDPGYATLVIPQPHASDMTRDRLAVFSEAAQRHAKVACSVWIPEWLEGPGALETELDPNVALFRSSDRCMAAIAAWQAREAWLKTLPRPSPFAATPQVRQAAQRQLAAAAHTVMTEREAKAALAGYGVPVVAEHLVIDVEQAVAAATSIGWPVAIKVESVDLPHKTEAGVIRLGLRDEQQVREAYAAIMEKAAQVTPRPRISGVIVQAMVPAGVEVMVGARVDPLFGPLVVVGLGGTLVELLRDTATDLAPLSRQDALDMLTRLKGAALFKGFRGSAPVNLARLADVVTRVAAFIADHAGEVREIDVNPLICRGDEIVAVDALIIRQAGGGLGG